MNWVGGARSRVKYQNERKIQKEFFERNRLMKKIKKARPISPGEGGMRTSISQDLLLLQTLNSVHGNSKQKQDLPRKPVIVNLDTSHGNVRRPERNLELPMSPIGKPSTLNLLDTTTGSSLNLSCIRNQPKVSTQKIPHHSVLQSFGPQFNIKGNQHTGLKPDHQLPTSSAHSLEPTVTETVLPTIVKHKEGTNKSKGNHYNWNNVFEDTSTTHPWHSGRKRKTDNDIVERTQRKSSLWEKSYDHETPFHFEKWDKKPRVEHMPTSKESLLDFHHWQGLDRTGGRKAVTKSSNDKNLETHEEFWNRRHASVEGASVSHQEAVQPAHQASELTHTSQFTRNESKGFFSSTSVAASVLEAPLSGSSHKHPKSTSTVFNESILGPIYQRQTTQNTTANTRKELPTKQVSSFEKMMLSMEKERPLAGSNCQRGVEKGRESEQAASGAGTKDYSIALHKEWRQFTMEEPRPVKSLKQPHVKEKATTSKEAPCCVKSDDCDLKRKQTKNLVGKLKNKKDFSVIEELFCLEEELASSPESEDMTAPSQDVLLTPTHLLSEEPFVCVPQAKVYITPTVETVSKSASGSAKTFDIPPDLVNASNNEMSCEKLRDSQITGHSLVDEQANDDVPVTDQARECYADDQVRLRNSCCTQTDKPHATLVKEVWCECDIWKVDPTLQFSSATVEAATQTDTKPLQVHREVQVDLIHSTPSTDAQNADGDEHPLTGNSEPTLGSSVTDLGNVDMATRLQMLESEVSRLQDELLTVQSTAIWQSLMLKLQRFDQRY